MLGEGGMGAVYLAEDPTLGRRVAVKVVSDRFTGTPAARDRFIREARSMATVEHPNVVRVYSFGEVEDRPYFVMEYVEGESLAQRLKRGRLPIAEALAILRAPAGTIGRLRRRPFCQVLHRPLFAPHRAESRRVGGYTARADPAGAREGLAVPF